MWHLHAVHKFGFHTLSGQFIELKCKIPNNPIQGFSGPETINNTAIKRVHDLGSGISRKYFEINQQIHFIVTAVM